jgi:hypothetical protein
VGPGLRDADALWERRAEEGGLERALAAYTTLLAGAPADPRVLARIARAQHRIGLVTEDPAAALVAYESAREVASTCIVTDPQVRAVLPSVGWVWTGPVLTDIGADRAECALWAAAASVGTVEVRGPGAALELEAVAPLAARALELRPNDPWALRTAAEIRLLDPGTPEEERTQALGLLEQAAGRAPAMLLFRVDLARANGQAVTDLPPPSPDEPNALENARARQLASTTIADVPAR